MSDLFYINLISYWISEISDGRTVRIALLLWCHLTRNSIVHLATCWGERDNINWMWALGAGLRHMHINKITYRKSLLQLFAYHVICTQQLSRRTRRRESPQSSWQTERTVAIGTVSKYPKRCESNEKKSIEQLGNQKSAEFGELSNINTFTHLLSCDGQWMLCECRCIVGHSDFRWYWADDLFQAFGDLAKNNIKHYLLCTPAERVSEMFGYIPHQSNMDCLHRPGRAISISGTLRLLSGELATLRTAKIKNLNKSNECVYVYVCVCAYM